jgi:predicted membrane protein
MARRREDRARRRDGFSHFDDESTRDSRRAHRRGFGSAVVGFGVLAAGIILTLDNLGVIEGEDYLSYWPLLLIVVGISHLVRPPGSRRLVGGVVWIAVGVTILLSNLGFILFDIWDLWPILLIVLGFSLISKPFRRRQISIDDAGGVFDVTAILGGVTRRISSDDFQGGDAMAFLGGCELDLRDSASEGGPAEIHAVAFWGGVEIRVPQDWEVQVRGTAILGAFDDKTRAVEGEGRKVLVVSGVAMMGSVEISN